jgi:hypothetical protein
VFSVSATIKAYFREWLLADLSEIIKQTEQPSSRRRHHRRRAHWLRQIRLIYFAYLLVPLIVGIVILAITAADSLSQVSRSQDDFKTVFRSLEDKSATELTLQDYQHVDESLVALNQALESAHTRTRPLRLLEFLTPGIQLRFKLLDAAIHATTGSRHFLAGLEPTVVHLERGGIVAAESTEAGNFGSSGERTSELLLVARSRFLAAQKEITSAQTILAELDLKGVSGKDLLSVETLREYIQQVENYNNLALQAPELLNLALGLDATQNYLILSQNNDELRPSGGYISTWGWLQVRSGQVRDYGYYATTVNSPVPPDATLVSEVQVPEWWIQYRQPLYAAWDGSWYADFSATAQMAAWYYNNGDNPFTPVDGVIGIDMVALEYLLEAVGPVTVPQYDVTVTSADFREVVYDIRVTREHKAFLAALYNQIVTQWKQADAITLGEINRALLQALQEKHLMLYFANPDLQAAAQALNWTGMLSIEADQDYLMVNDANLGNKSSSSVQRTITYDVTISSNDSATGRLAVVYDFSAATAQEDPAVRPEHYGNQKDYYSILQVLVPSGSQLIATDGSVTPQTIDADAYTSFVGRAFVLYDGTSRIEYEYALPNVLEDVGDYKRYRLQFEKQPGTRADAALVTIFLPAGSSLVSVSPVSSAQYDLGQQVVEFNLSLLQDQTIELTYSN